MKAEDLPELPPVMHQAPNVAIARHVSFEDFLKLFDENLHGKIRGACLGPEVTHVMCFENLDRWSSRFGERSALPVGPQNTYTLQAVLGKPYVRLGDAPSKFQYAVAYASVEALKEALPAQQEGGEQQATKH